MQSLAAVDWMILLIYFFFVVSIGLGLRQYIATSGDYLLGGRALPAWLCGLAMTGASLGALEVLAMGAAAARFGLASASFFSLGSVIPLLFAGWFLVPVYYASGARSMPDYLRLRFGGKTAATAAVFYLAVNLLAAAIGFFVMARALAALHLFDVLLHAQSLGSGGVQLLLIVLPAAIVLIFLLTSGLAATLYTQVMQFFVLIAAFLPVVLLGLRQVGGWNSVKAGLPAALLARQWHGVHAGGMGAAAIAAGLGLVLTAGAWCADQSLLQAPLAAENAGAARRASVIAAAVRALLPVVLVLPGAIAIALPTPQSTTFVRTENGAIYHDITVVPQAVEAGQGLIPARTDSLGDPLGGTIQRDAAGHALLNYGLATPNLLLENLPNGLLGLALAALLACLTGGVAARATACSTIFTVDLWQPLLSGADEDQKRALAVGEQKLALAGGEKKPILAGRLAGLGAVVVSALIACAMLRLHGMPGTLELLLLSLAVFAAPLLPTFLLAAFWPRATGVGVSAGLLAGFAAAVAHYGLTLPAGVPRGWNGGWIAAVHRYAGVASQALWTAIFAIAANLLLAVTVSLVTTPRPQAESARAGLAVRRPKRAKADPAPAGLIAFALLAALAVSFLLVLL